VLLGCGAAKEIPCSPAKDLFSKWTSRSTNVVYPLQSCEFEVYCQAGDDTLWFQEDGFFLVFGNGDLDIGEWEISCRDILSMTYDSTGSTTRFD